ncbi:MAG: PIN domain-containing protein [Candidatus Bathyarchaeia archaeon]
MIFIDTTVWVGDADLNDDFHESSHRIMESVRTGKTPLGLVSDFIIDELVTLLGKRKGFGAGHAKETGMAILHSPRIFTVFVDDSILKEALAIYPTFNGKLSLTDVVTTVVMKRYAVNNVFSHDSDFDAVKGVRRLTSVQKIER